MAFEHPGDGALDYSPCRYGESRLLFRGPRKRLEDPCVVCFGGTETYGKFIPEPFPDLLAQRFDATVVNMGAVNAGIDVYLGDRTLIDAARAARVTVIQVMGAHNLSNRFYTVHPRRNDRFLSASTLMKTIYRDVDFTEFAFTRHLLGALQARSAERFGLVVEELRLSWIARMKALLERVGTPTVLVWVGARPPAPAGAPVAPLSDRDPPLVDRGMLDALRPHLTEYVEVVASPEALAAGTEGMVFTDLEAPAAAELLGVPVHREVAAQLAPVLSRYLT